VLPVPTPSGFQAAKDGNPKLPQKRLCMPLEDANRSDPTSCQLLTVAEHAARSASRGIGCTSTQTAMKPVAACRLCVWDVLSGSEAAMSPNTSKLVGRVGPVLGRC